MADTGGGSSAPAPGTSPSKENKAGSDCTGNSGAKNRVLTLSNTSTSSSEIVFLDGSALKSSYYTASHLAASSTITFTIPVWNDQDIVVLYFT